jgi:hypothetical protein
MSGLRGVTATSGTDTWLTPPAILAALGPFDLDPCAAPEPRPWPTAARHIARPADGLAEPWEGRVWCNPPYSSPGVWAARMAAHGHGTALIFARTETRWFVEYVWRRATALLFLEGRIGFLRLSGACGTSTAPAPSVLVAYGSEDAERLAGAGLSGAYIHGWQVAGVVSVRQEDLFGGAA